MRRFFQIGVVLKLCAVLAGAGPADSEKRESPSFAGAGPASAAGPAKLSKITPACRKSSERATQWLLSAMRRDGSLPAEVGREPDLGCTAMFGLVLVSQGNTCRAGRHSKVLRSVVDSVMDQCEFLPENELPFDPKSQLQRKIGRCAPVFVAALFLSQVLGEAGDAEAEVRLTLEKLVRTICRMQGSDGTWGNESWAPVLGTVLGWESLRASESVGLRFEASTENTAEALLKMLRSHVQAQDWMHSFYKDAASIRVLYSLHHRDDPAFQDCVARIQQTVRTDNRIFAQAGGEEYLAFFLVTECMLKERNESWQSWYPTVRDRLLAIQNRDGSWSGHHCITSRVFCTAAALLTLQAPNLYLPISDL